MSEVNRIITEYPELHWNYLQEEDRCGFHCDLQRKKLWAVLLDLGQVLDRICREHGLTYMLIGGSMLGAVRHKGFIPWDDDLDIGMPRKDYEKLKTLAACFGAPYELQIPGETPGYFFSFMKLRNNNTTSYIPDFAGQGFNMGIWLDIFPFDEWVPEGGKVYYDRIMELNVDNSNYMRRSIPHPTEAQKARAAAWSGRDPRENLAEIEAIARRFEKQDCDHYSHAVITVDKYPNNYFRKEYFRTLIRVPFEGFMLPIPAGYDGFLSAEYGNYMEFPPVSERGEKHANANMNADIPWAEFRKSLGL